MSPAESKWLEHLSGIGAYQVNCLVPHDPDIRIAGQDRNYSQGHYELEYEQANIHSDPTYVLSWPGRMGWLGVSVLLLLTQVAFRRSNEVSR